MGYQIFQPMAIVAGLFLAWLAYKQFFPDSSDRREEEGRATEGEKRNISVRRRCASCGSSHVVHEAVDFVTIDGYSTATTWRRTCLKCGETKEDI